MGNDEGRGDALGFALIDATDRDLGLPTNCLGAQ